MKLQQLVQAMEAITPSGHAEPWDNVGLIAGDPDQTVSRVMLTIDYTPAVAAETRALQCDAVISYHPPLFSPLKKLTATGPAGLVFNAIRSGIAIYSPHTAMDAAAGGTNDVLADAIGMDPVRANLRAGPTTAAFCKLVVFVPESAMPKVTAAVFAAGAGHIGNYSGCGFQSSGTGMFTGNAFSHPTTGEKETAQAVPEKRFETLVPQQNISAVLSALQSAHPYEEPVFELLALQPLPSSVGMGRVGTLITPATLEDLIERLKASFGLTRLLSSHDRARLIKRVAVCAGAGGELLNDAITAGADLFVTGELRHHDALTAARAGMAMIATLHSNSERPALRWLQKRLASLIDIPIEISAADRDPFVVC